MATQPIMTREDFKKRVFQLREMIKALAEESRDLNDNKAFYSPIPVFRDIGEMRANIMLAYRHMEDARMRLGKAVQAYDGGVSCYKQ